MSDFTERAAAEADRQIRRAMYHGEPPAEEMGILGFVSGAEWARREVAARALREAGTWLGDEGAIGIEELLKWRADRIEKGEVDV